MYKFIKKLFIKDYQEVDSSIVRFRYGVCACIFGVVSNIILFGLKMLIGALSGSISIIADAINNLSDAGSSLVTMLGFKLSHRPPDAEHPFGHARYEYITGFVVAFVVLFIGILLGKSSIEKIISPSPLESSVWTFFVLAVAILVKLWQGGLYSNFGKSIDSTALIATSKDSRNDVITTAAVLFSTIVDAIWPNIYIGSFKLSVDGITGTLVSIFILISSIKLIKETLDPLLGAVPDHMLVKKISDKVLSYDKIIGIHDIMVHNYGPANCFATLHAEVDANDNFVEAHDLIDNIERDFMKDLHIFLVIHLDPVVIDDPETNSLKEEIIEIVNKQIGEEASIHDFRLVKGTTHTNVLFDIVLPYGTKWNKEGLIKLFEDNINNKEHHSYYFVINVDNKYV